MSLKCYLRLSSRTKNIRTPIRLGEFMSALSPAICSSSVTKAKEIKKIMKLEIISAFG